MNDTRQIMCGSLTAPMDSPLPHQSAGDTVHHDPFWEVHGVGHCQHNQACIGSGGPVKQVVQHRLLACP